MLWAPACLLLLLVPLGLKNQQGSYGVLESLEMYGIELYHFPIMDHFKKENKAFVFPIYYS